MKGISRRFICYYLSSLAYFNNNTDLLYLKQCVVSVLLYNANVCTNGHGKTNEYFYDDTPTTDDYFDQQDCMIAFIYDEEHFFS